MASLPLGLGLFVFLYLIQHQRNTSFNPQVYFVISSVLFFLSTLQNFHIFLQEEQKLVTMLEREMVQQNPGINWNDIAGLQRESL